MSDNYLRRIVKKVTEKMICRTLLFMNFTIYTIPFYYEARIGKHNLKDRLGHN